MKYTELNIQTQRDAPKNARTEGIAFLVRAGYLTRESEMLQLGKLAINKLQKIPRDPSFFTRLALPILSSESQTFHLFSTGSTEIIHCESCTYTERLELARFRKKALAAEKELPLEKVLTPDCHTIEALANFIGVPKEKTAKALMYTRIADDQFVFIVIRGDMQLSEAKLKGLVGEVRAATSAEIFKSGAVAGYASPIGLKNTLIVIDDLVPQSQNLVAGANEEGYHFKHTNYPRDYSAEITADIAQANAGDPCINCGNPLSILAALNLATRSEYDFANILLALAEIHHDAKGLTLPEQAAPFDVYLMHIPGKEMDTLAKAGELYDLLESAGFTVLFDDRDERAGVKFNDADLIGCPVRITVGEKNLKEGMVELKLRKADKNILVSQTDIVLKVREVFDIQPT